MLNQKMKKTGCFTYFFIFFGIPFALVGIFTGYKSIRNFSDNYTMKNWKEVPAKIITVKLISHDSDDSTTYSINLIYRYQINGKKYEGSRVNISGGSESGSYYPILYRKLENIKEAEKEYRCFVNPNNHAESILNNKLRLLDSLLFPIMSILFSGVGIGLIIFGIFSVKKAKICSNLQQENPDKPWLHKPEWKDGKIKSSNKIFAVFIMLFAVFWNLISWPVAILLVPEILKDKEYVGLFVLLFPLVGIGLIIWAVVSFRRWKKYGESIFVMKSNPGVVGGALKGVIVSNVNIEPVKGFKVELNCVNRYTSGTGENRKSNESILWQDICLIKHEMYKDDLTKSAIPVIFKIPFDSKETTENNSNNVIIWRLKISAEVPGVDYKATFEIPVFKTEESSEEFELDNSILKEYKKETTHESLLENSGIILEYKMNGGLKFIFPTCGKQSSFLLLFIFIWSAIAIYLWTKTDAPMMIKIIFSAIIPFVIYVFLDMMLYKSEVTVRKGSLWILSGWLGYRSEKNLSSTDIAEIKTKRGMQAGKTLYYSIVATTNNDEKITLAKRVDNLQYAEYIINEIKKELNHGNNNSL